MSSAVMFLLFLVIFLAVEIRRVVGKVEINCLEMYLGIRLN